MRGRIVEVVLGCSGHYIDQGVFGNQVGYLQSAILSTS